MGTRILPSLATPVLISALTGCGRDISKPDVAYDAIVLAYMDERLDEVYDNIEPETRGMLDATNRALGQADPGLQNIDDRERFKKMWGKRRAGIRPVS